MPALSANPQFARAVVQNASNIVFQLNNDGGKFQKVALQQGQVVNVIMTFTPPDFAQPAAIEVLDGGAIGGLPVDPSVPSSPVDRVVQDVSKIIPAPMTPTPPPIKGTISQPVPLPSPPVAPSLPDPNQFITPLPVPDPQSLVDTGATIPVSPTGQLLFSFRPGDGPGLHRVSVIVNGNQYIFQFWQQDPSRPNPNPNLIRVY